jgi:GT2 family glycosyltransferase
MNVGSLRKRAGARVRRTELDGARLPISALRSVLDQRSSGAHWSMHPDGVLGRSIVMDAGAVYTVPIALANSVTLSGRVMLLPHDWIDGADRLSAKITSTARDGRDDDLWSATLRAGDRGNPRGQGFRCAVPFDAVAISLTVIAPAQLAPRGVTRALWREPALHDPRARPVDVFTGGARGPLPTASSAPVISVLTPVHDPPLEMLQEAVASVLGQTYPKWELCLVDDGSRDPRVKAALQRYAADEPRVKLLEHGQAQGISSATNSALELASGDYIALLDHDDTLSPEALQQVADRLISDPGLDMVYSDEDVVADGAVLERHAKPGWSPEHMRALMYTCHLGVYRRSMAQQVGGFQSRFDGCQDYDFVLRLMERTDRIAHIPQILYHWRAHPHSTAGGDAKPYAYLAQPGAISEHLGRAGVEADVQFANLPGLHRVVHRVDPGLTVEIALACEDPDTLRAAAHTWNTQPHPSWRAVIATNNHTQITDALHAAGIPDQRITLIDADPDPTTALHQAAQHATATHLLLMQAPAIGLTHDWLTRLLGYSNQDGIAAAGPVILAPDGRIQQAGIALPEGIPLHLNYGQPAAAAQPVVYNLSAVSGVLATSRTSYERLGGLRPEYRELALIDYCVRAGACGNDGRTVLVPDARLRIEADRPINDLSVIWRLRDGWRQTHTHDPYYNRAYRTDRGDFIAR